MLPGASPAGPTPQRQLVVLLRRVSQVRAGSQTSRVPSAVHQVWYPWENRFDPSQVKLSRTCRLGVDETKLAASSVLPVPL